jgi:hypothetical protein
VTTPKKAFEPFGSVRDEQGRIIRLIDLLAVALVGFLISVAGLLVVDGLFALIGLGDFGDLNGWLGLIFPALIFVEQFRAADKGGARIVALLVAAVCAIGLGALAAGLVSGLPAIASGAIAALVATLVYCLVWHVATHYFLHR